MWKETIRDSKEPDETFSSPAVSAAPFGTGRKVKWRRRRLLPPPRSAAQLHNEKQFCLFRFLFFFIFFSETQLEELAVTLPSNAFYRFVSCLGTWCQMDKPWSETNTSAEGRRPKTCTIQCSIALEACVLLLYCC